MADDGTYVADGLEPGTYVVTTHPAALDSPVTLTVTAGRTVIELNLDLAP